MKTANPPLERTAAAVYFTAAECRASAAAAAQRHYVISHQPPMLDAIEFTVEHVGNVIDGNGNVIDDIDFSIELKVIVIERKTRFD